MDHATDIQVLGFQPLTGTVDHSDAKVGDKIFASAKLIKIFKIS